MDLVIVTPEIAPYSGSSYEAVRTSLLAKSLRGLGTKVTVVTPRYRHIEPDISLARRLTKLETSVAGQSYSCTTYDGRTSTGVDILLLEHEAFSDPTLLLTGQDNDFATLQAASIFASASRTWLESRDCQPDALQLHDWCGAFFLVLESNKPPARMRKIIVTHNATKWGVFARARGAELGIAKAILDAPGSSIAFVLEAAAERAEYFVVPSFTEWNESLRQSKEPSLNDFIVRLGPRFRAVADGIDSSVWNPLTDAHLSSRFGPVERRGKQQCKSQLQYELSLPTRAEVPLLAVAPAVGEKTDLLLHPLKEALHNDVQIVVQLAANQSAPESLTSLAAEWPDRLQISSAAGDPFWHRLLSAADLVWIPNSSLTSSTIPLCAHRYGALPIAPRTGTFVDTLVDCEANLRTGTAFLFDPESGSDVIATVQRALAAFSQVTAFESLRRRVMSLDHSWERRARIMERLYQCDEPAVETTSVSASV